jgi:N-acylneuraminate cytidylyltransferase
MKTLFIIPARGGSKSIPNKNTKLLAGKPLISYSIDIARFFTSDEHICVSTDDEKIIEIVEDYGLRVPFKRPANLATDHSGIYEVLLHALKHYSGLGNTYDTIILLQPTSPFRRVKDIINGLEIYNKMLSDIVIGVRKSPANPYWDLFEESTENIITKSINSLNFVRRQDIPDVYQINGALYIINTKSINTYDSINSMPIKRKLLMDDINSVDIDHQLDWLYCEFLIEKELIDLKHLATL